MEHAMLMESQACQECQRELLATEVVGNQGRPVKAVENSDEIQRRFGRTGGRTRAGWSLRVRPVARVHTAQSAQLDK